MAWADNYIKRLQAGETVQFRPRGDSMRPRIAPGQLVTVEPITSFFMLSCGDIVLCRVAGHQYLHLVDQLDPVDRRVQIVNARGHVNGWTTVDNVATAMLDVARDRHARGERVSAKAIVEWARAEFRISINNTMTAAIGDWFAAQIPGVKVERRARKATP